MLQSLLERLTNPENLIKLAKGVGDIIAILVAGLVVLRLVDSALKRWAIAHAGSSRGESRTETLRHIVGSFGKIVIWGIAVIMIMGEFGLSTGPILTTAGILGLAVGFGAQSLVKDVI